MSLIISCLTFLTFQTVVQSLSGTAQLTWYISYAPCCPDNANYDPNADTTECDQYSACSYSGDFWALGIKSFDYVQNTNLVAFFNPSDPNGDNFMSNYGGKEITLSKNGITFTAIIADSCADSDCGGCCTRNSAPSGFLVDMEYWTAINNFGSTDDMHGQIQFTIGDIAPTSSTTSPPVNGDIIITNQASTQSYWVAFYISNVDLSCGGTITNVEITDNNHYSGTWVAFDDNQYGYYSFPNDGNGFVGPISVRITRNYNGSDKIIACPFEVDFTAGQTFDFGNNFCRTSTSTTTTTTSTSSTTTRLPSTSTSTTTTTTTTNAPTNGNIIITNKGSTQKWWVAFFISNIDLSCGGTITNVEITDNNHVGTWVAFDDNQWGYYSFQHGGNKFVEPISVRITKSYNTVSESIVANDLVSLTGDETFDFGSNFCLTSSTTTSKQPSKNPSENPSEIPTSTPSKFPTEPPTHFPTLKPSENPTLFPSKNPTLFPSKNPSKNPIVSPTRNPTFNPSENPTLFPSENPTSIPSKNPIVSPTKNPTLFPSKPPTLNPSENGEMTCNSVIDWKYDAYSSALVNAWNENTMSNIYSSEAEDKFLTEYPQCGDKNTMANKLEYYYYFQKIETKLTIKMHICCGTEKTFGCCYDLPCNYANVYKANQAVINDKYHKNAHNTTSNKNNNVFDIKQYIIFCILGLLIICCGCGIIQLIIYRKNKSLKVNKKQIELANVIEMNDINGGQLPGPQNVQMPSIGNMNEMTDGTTVIQTQMTCTDSADLPTVMQPQMQINVTEITQPKIL